MQFQIKSFWSVAIVGVIVLLMMNSSMVLFGINADLFGILASVLLFCTGGRKTSVNVSYFLVALIIVLEFISYKLHTKSLHFLSLMLLVCLIFHSITGKFSVIALVCLLLFSTLFNKFFEHLTIEIKQWLCQAVFTTLKDVVTFDRVEGVNFYIKGSKITVDTACMGLSMFKTGLLTGAILLTLEEKKSQKHFAIGQIVAFCVVVILLNLVSNYFRIIALVLLDATRENILHHAIGLGCFILYQVLPMLLIIQHFKPRKPNNTDVVIGSNKVWITVVFAIILVTSLQMKIPQKYHLLEDLDAKYKVANGTWVNDEVFKIETAMELVYIKTPSHKPLICWTGDGYKITHSTEILRDGEKIWFHQMEKGGVTYESFWWYESGNKKYTSFLEVMLKRLVSSQPIRLINETRRIG